MTPNNYLYGDNANSTNTPLSSGAEWVGEARDMALGGYAGIVVSLKTDVDGTLYMEQSVDGVMWDSSLAFDVDGGLPISAGADITLKLLNSSANNTEVVAGFDIVIVRDP